MPYGTREKLLPEPLARCGICGVRPVSSIYLVDVDGQDVCNRCLVERARGAKMTGDAAQGRPRDPLQRYRRRR